MHISKWKKPFWEDYILYSPGIGYSEKCKTMEMAKRSVVASVLGRQSTEDLRGSENTLYDTTMVDTCHYQLSSTQSFNRVWLFVTPWTAAHQASLSITNSQSLLKLMSIESVMPSNHLLLASISPSIRAFSSESGWMKHKLESRLQGEISITSDIYHQ